MKTKRNHHQPTFTITNAKQNLVKQTRKMIPEENSDHQKEMKNCGNGKS